MHDMNVFQRANEFDAMVADAVNDFCAYLMSDKDRLRYAASRGDGECGLLLLKMQEILCDSGKELQAHSYRKKKISHRVKRMVMERDQYRCLCCGTWEALTIDHIIPEVHGGNSEPQNLQVLCQSCNSKKGTKTTNYRS